MEIMEKARLSGLIKETNERLDCLCADVLERQFVASFVMAENAFYQAALNAEIDGAKIRVEKFYDDEGYLRPIWECLDVQFLRFLVKQAEKKEKKNGQTAN